MGWAYGILDGREVGYGVQATCDAQDCEEVIDRGLGWRCGELHKDEGCGMYFCSNHGSRPDESGDCPHGPHAYGRRTDGGREGVTP